MQQQGDSSNSNNSPDDPINAPLPPLEEIDWDAFARDHAPPEWDLLLSATAKNHIDRVQDMLTNQGVPATHSNGIGQTSLHIAVLWGHIDIARILLQAGADVNAANKIAGSTPLHTVLQSKKTSDKLQYDLVILLLDVGHADPVPHDAFGRYPADYISAGHAYRGKLLERLKKPNLNATRMRDMFIQDLTRTAPTCRKAS